VNDLVGRLEARIIYESDPSKFTGISVPIDKENNGSEAPALFFLV
jgi:hypothetical protein